MTTTYFSFNSEENAEKFLGALFDHGATSEDVSVIARNSGATLDASDVEKQASSGITTTTATDFGKGAMIGTGVGLAIGIGAGLASVLVPGVGIVIGGGALASALAGAGTATAAGALAGGIAGYLRDMGVEGEVPDEFERDFQDDYVIVAVRTRLDGITLDELDALADKYHASRNTLNRQTVAAVNVEKETVKRTMVDPVTGEEATSTVDIRTPEGADRTELIPVSPVLPIPGSKEVQPAMPIEPLKVDRVEPAPRTATTVSAARGETAETTVSGPIPGSKAEVVEVRPDFRTTDEKIVAVQANPDEEQATAYVQSAEPARGDVTIQKTTREEPEQVQQIETVRSVSGDIESVRSTVSRRPIGPEIEERVTVDPVTGKAEREIVEHPAEGEMLENIQVETEPLEESDPARKFYKA